MGAPESRLQMNCFPVCQNVDGFLLIEVIFSLTILMMLALSITYYHANSIAECNRSHIRSRALGLLCQEMESSLAGECEKKDFNDESISLALTTVPVTVSHTSDLPVFGAHGEQVVKFLSAKAEWSCKLGGQQSAHIQTVLLRYHEA